MQHNYGGVYANLDYVKLYGNKTYKEYPKHIPTGPHGKFEEARDEIEESKILAKLQKDDDDAPAEVVNYVADPEKEILISRAAELGVAINRKWSKAKIAQTIQDAEDSIDLLPVEAAPAEPEQTEELKTELIAEAKALGIPATKLWGIPRLRATISEVKSKKKA